MATSGVSFDWLLVANDVDLMCRHIFGKPYSSISPHIYPSVGYHTFSIKKKGGGVRTIDGPHYQLKKLQRRLLDFLTQNSSAPRGCVHGFVRSRSIVTNALEHCGPRTRYVFNVDLEDFFPSITFSRVRGVFMSQPFGFSFSCATVLAQMTCYLGKLPQGAPTSPFIANLVCRSLDTKLVQLASEHGARYSRYCDDITFSFRVRKSRQIPASICLFNGDEATPGQELKSIIAANSFSINPSKVRLSSRFRRMEVTGLTINEAPNVKKAFVDKIRGALHAWERYGFHEAERRWQELPSSTIRRTAGKAPLHRVLWGKLLHLKAVRGGEDIRYTRLAEKYNTLIAARQQSDAEFKGSLLPILPVVRSEADFVSSVFVLECIADHPQFGAVGKTSTAFAISPDTLVSCDHCLRFEEVENNQEISDYIHKQTNPKLEVVQPSSGSRWEVQVLATNPNLDLCLLKFVDKLPPSLRHFSTQSTVARINSGVHVAGYPNWGYSKKNATHTHGVVENVFPKTTFQRVEISNWIRAGQSGGPAYTDDFRLVGMAQEGAAQNTGSNICLCVSEIEKWLKNGTPP